MRKPKSKTEPQTWIILDRDDAPCGRISSSYENYEYWDEVGVHHHGCLHYASIYMHVIGHKSIDDKARSWVDPNVPSMGALWCLLARHIDAIEKMLGYEDAEALPEYQDFPNNWKGIFEAVGYSVVEAQKE